MDNINENNSNYAKLDAHYLLNPYYQLSAWLLYRIYDPKMGEKLLELLLEFKKLALEFDTINKERFKEDFDNWSPYNVWIDIVISQYINEYIDKLREHIALNQKSSSNYYSYNIDFITINYLINEKEIFTVGKAFPSEQALQDYNKLASQITDLDRFFRYGDAGSGGMKIKDVFNHITDHKEREPRTFENLTFDEPTIYPTYLISRNSFETEEKVEQPGVYLPKNILETAKLYTPEVELFQYTTMYSLDREILGEQICRVMGPVEYGLYYPMNPYYMNSLNSEDEEAVFPYTEDLIETDWYYVREIPPNTEGLPNNPLRLNDLRYPLKNGETYKTLEQIKQQYGSAYQNPHAMVKQYFQVVNRYEKYYKDYLLANGVKPNILKTYNE